MTLKKETNILNSARISAKNILLVYPTNCKISLEVFLELLKSKLSVCIIKNYFLVKKYIGDKLSIHCYLELTKKVDTRNPNFFDIKDGEGVTYTGAYCTVKSKKSTVDSFFESITTIKNQEMYLISSDLKNKQK